MTTVIITWPDGTRREVPAPETGETCKVCLEEPAISFTLPGKPAPIDMMCAGCLAEMIKLIEARFAPT